MMNIVKRCMPVCFVLFLLFLWEMSVSLFHIEPWVLPSPSAIGKEFLTSARQLPAPVWATASIAISGLFAGTVIGILTAGVLHLFSTLRRMVYPLIILSQNIPMIALAPLLVMWFGFGVFPKILVVALICFFPVTVSLLGGLAETDRTLLTYLKMAGASRMQIFFKCECPSALPAFFSGLKLSATYSVMGAVIAEWLGAENGIGVMMQLASSTFRTDRVFVTILLVAGLSLFFFALITLFERAVTVCKGNQRRASR
ncbi:ABC transporter permease [Thermoactinomyces intermedius]|jgi:ABC-type nitrate/sulfonate/bicarbonate transport system permease component|uniref:ABC transporter permease n=2 Tax=Thermoactinomycetaceae TaxID=186824 RepID=A0A8I1DES6_THEIN|nr:ABC transporter permease [Thermoactinomyces intermedius]MBA4837502.1 ABC transporter permease [Thermoactinomyces intermedius]MBH8595257.1 ABC transporter permease [Thermoactinomyces intermedius]MBH8601802.1 ABC transporter permease [Thermoactinomyces sp. CICC 23799]